MFDLVMIRKNPEEVGNKLARKGLVIDFTEFRPLMRSAGR